MLILLSRRKFQHDYVEAIYDVAHGWY